MYYKVKGCYQGSLCSPRKHITRCLYFYPSTEEQEHVKHFVFIMWRLITEKKMGTLKSRYLD